MKEKLVEILSSKYDSEQYTCLERYALYELMSKVKKEESLSSKEKELIVDEFLFNYLIFDELSGEPVGNTIEIEKMIDFILQSKEL